MLIFVRQKGKAGREEERRRERGREEERREQDLITAGDAKRSLGPADARGTRVPKTTARLSASVSLNNPCHNSPKFCRNGENPYRIWRSGGGGGGARRTYNSLTLVMI